MGVNNPRIAVAVTIDEPGPVYFGGVVCAPAFKNICENVLKYLETQELPELELVTKDAVGFID